MARAHFAFGDLILRGSTQDTRGVGLIADLRRTDCRVQYLSSGGSQWVSLRELRHARPEEVEGSLEKLVSDLLALLGATGLEFTLMEVGRCRLVASHGALLPDVVDRVRALLGERLGHYVIRPQGMHRIQTILEFSVDSAWRKGGPV